MLDHTPDDELLAFLEGDVRKGRIAGFEFDLAVALVELFDGDLPIDHGHDDAAILGLQGAIDDQQVPIEDPEENHRVPTDDEQESSRWVGDELRRQIYPLLPQIFRRRWKACSDLLHKLCQPHRQGVDFEDLIR